MSLPTNVEGAIIAAILALGAGLATWVGRWVLFRMTLSGRFAVSADEELKALREDLKKEVHTLRQELEVIRQQNRQLIIENTALNGKVLTLQQSTMADGIRITELEAENATLRAKVSQLEAKLGSSQSGV